MANATASSRLAATPPDTSKRTVFKADPSHHAMPTFYLKQLRDNGDYRRCDVELRVGNIRVRLHSAVIAAHSAKVAKLVAESNDPLRIDMSDFKSESVNKVVEWLYSGEVELHSDNIIHDLSVTSYLGVSALHKYLEQSLIALANSPRTRIEAVNIATNTVSGTSDETKDTVLRIIYHNRSSISAPEIMALSPWAVKALVSAGVSVSVKVALINISLNWMRHPRNLPHAASILPRITIDQMKDTEMMAFQQTLKTALRNPSTRQLVTVSLDKAGRPVIRMDKNSFQRNAGKTVEDLDSKKPATNVFRDLIPKVLKEIKLISEEESGSAEDDEGLPLYTPSKKHNQQKNKRKSAERTSTRECSTSSTRTAIPTPPPTLPDKRPPMAAPEIAPPITQVFSIFLIISIA